MNNTNNDKDTTVISAFNQSNYESRSYDNSKKSLHRLKSSPSK